MLPIGGMHCTAWARNVESALPKVDGVLDTSVDLAAERASVVLISGPTEKSALERAVTDAGFEIPDPSFEPGQTPNRDAQRMRHAKRQMWIAWASAGPFILLMLAHMALGIA